MSQIGTILAAIDENLKFSCLYLFPFSHKVVLRKASGENWTRNQLRMVSKFRNVWLCVFSGVVATTLIYQTHTAFDIDYNIRFFGSCLHYLN